MLHISKAGICDLCFSCIQLNCHINERNYWPLTSAYGPQCGSVTCPFLFTESSACACLLNRIRTPCRPSLNGLKWLEWSLMLRWLVWCTPWLCCSKKQLQQQQQHRQILKIPVSPQLVFEFQNISSELMETWGFEHSAGHHKEVYIFKHKAFLAGKHSAIWLGSKWQLRLKQAVVTLRD